MLRWNSGSVQETKGKCLVKISSHATSPNVRTLTKIDLQPQTSWTDENAETAYALRKSKRQPFKGSSAGQQRGDREDNYFRMIYRPEVILISQTCFGRTIEMLILNRKILTCASACWMHNLLVYQKIQLLSKQGTSSTLTYKAHKTEFLKLQNRCILTWPFCPATKLISWDNLKTLAMGMDKATRLHLTLKLKIYCCTSTLSGEKKIQAPDRGLERLVKNLSDIGLWLLPYCCFRRRETVAQMQLYFFFWKNCNRLIWPSCWSTPFARSQMQLAVVVPPRAAGWDVRMRCAALSPSPTL